MMRKWKLLFQNTMFFSESIAAVSVIN